MATSYSFITSGVANAAVSSTRVKVVANNACFYALGTAGLASATANVGPLIAANRPTDITMFTSGNIASQISITPAQAGQITAITVTQIGTVNPRGFVGDGQRYIPS